MYFSWYVTTIHKFLIVQIWWWITLFFCFDLLCFNNSLILKVELVIPIWHSFKFIAYNIWYLCTDANVHKVTTFLVSKVKYLTVRSKVTQGFLLSVTTTWVGEDDIPFPNFTLSILVLVLCNVSSWMVYFVYVCKFGW